MPWPRMRLDEALHQMHQRAARLRAGHLCCIVEHANTWLLANKRLDHRNDRLTSIIDGLLTAARIFRTANRTADFRKPRLSASKSCLADRKALIR